MAEPTEPKQNHIGKEIMRLARELSESSKRQQVGRRLYAIRDGFRWLTDDEVTRMRQRRG